MTIKKLFDVLLSTDIQEKIKGELTLHGKKIIWAYDITKNSERLGDDNNEGVSVLIDDNETDYTGYIDTSIEEMLQQACDEDMEIIQNYVYEMNDCIDWSYSDPHLGETTISFKIY